MWGDLMSEMMEIIWSLRMLLLVAAVIGFGGWLYSLGLEDADELA